MIFDEIAEPKMKQERGQGKRDVHELSDSLHEMKSR
jgi:hypothetical protein